MHVCACVCMHVRVCAHVYMCIHVCAHMYVNARVCACVCALTLPIMFSMQSAGADSSWFLRFGVGNESSVFVETWLQAFSPPGPSMKVSAPSVGS